MARKKPFALRVDIRILDALKRWADDELRSVNGQIEYLLRDALRRAGRLDSRGQPAQPPPDTRGESDDTE